MTIPKSTATIGVGVLALFVVSVLYLHVREIRRIETVAVNEIKAKIEKEEAAKRAAERKKLEEKIALHEKAIEHTSRLYQDALGDAATQRAAKESARRANATLNASWEIKFTAESKAHQETIQAWAVSDKILNASHDQVVRDFRLEVDELKRYISSYQKDQDEKAGIILDLKARLALEKRKAGRRLVWGPYGGIGVDKKPSAGLGIMYYIGRIA